MAITVLSGPKYRHVAAGQNGYTEATYKLAFSTSDTTGTIDAPFQHIEHIALDSENGPEKVYVDPSANTFDTAGLIPPDSNGKLNLKRTATTSGLVFSVIIRGRA